MLDRIKVFWSFEELSRDEKYEKKSFEELNDFIENNPGVDIESVRESYLKVLSEENFEQNKFDYEELDFVVKKTLEESGEAINSILLFLDFKYREKSEMIKEVFSDTFFLIDENVLEKIVSTIMTKKNWFMQLSNHNWEIKIYFDFENFEFLEALKRLKNNLDREINKQKN